MMLMMLSFLLGTSDPALAPKEAAPATSVRVVLFDLSSATLSSTQLAMVQQSLLTELRKLQGVSVIGMDEVRALLSAEEQRQMAGCGDESCLSSLVGALGADYLVVGELGVVGRATVFNARRIVMTTAQASHFVEKRMLGGGGEEVLTAIGPVVEELFPDFGLRQGQIRGVMAATLARWNPPPLAPWMTVSSATVSVVSLVSSVVFVVRASGAAADRNALVEASANEPVDGSKVREYENRANRATLLARLFGVLGVLTGAGAGVMFPFTDWQRTSAGEETTSSVGLPSVVLGGPY